TIHNDGWRIEGCPVNGPSIAADGKRVAVSWFTAARESQRVNIAFSTEAGASFAQAVQVDEGSPVGRVEVQMLGDGSALVCWLERTAKGGNQSATRSARWLARSGARRRNGRSRTRNRIPTNDARR